MTTLQYKKHLPSRKKELENFLVTRLPAITGQVHYTPPEGEALIRGMLKDFENYFNDDSDDGQILIRVVLMPLYLVKHGYLRFPILFLSEYIFQNKSEYYRRLREVITILGDTQK